MGSNAPEKPPSFDKLVKAFLRHYPLELGEWLLGERPESAVELETTQALAAARTADKLLRLGFRSRPGVLLQLEVQLQGDATMPRRMAEYFGFSLAALERPAQEGLRPAAVVLYLDRDLYREDRAFFDLAGDLGFRFFASYRVLKLWELPAEAVLRMESPGLCPFVPLMAGKAEDLVVRSVEKIRGAPERQASFADKRLLLEALSTMAGRVIKDTSLLESLLADPEIRKTDLFSRLSYNMGRKEGKVEGREEGLHEGEEQALREAIADILTARFGSVSEDVRARLAAIHTRDELKRLVAAAARAADLDAFQREVDDPPGAEG